MKFSNYKYTLLYPLAVWLLFDLIAFAFGFTQYPDLSKAFLLSDVTPLFLSIMFGMWIGSESNGIFGAAGAARNAILVSFITGMVIVVLTITLINNSPVFLTYATTVYTNYSSVQAPLVNLAISTCIGNIFVATVAALTSFSLVSKLNRKK